MILQVDKDGEDFIKGLADIALRASGLQNLQVVNKGLASIDRVDVQAEASNVESLQRKQ